MKQESSAELPAGTTMPSAAFAFACRSVPLEAGVSMFQTKSASEVSDGQLLQDVSHVDPDCRSICMKDPEQKSLPSRACS